MIMSANSIDKLTIIDLVEFCDIIFAYCILASSEQHLVLAVFPTH